MSAALAVPAGALGLAIGSFLNVVVHRVPRGRSVVHPGSACPVCEHPIRWYDNVPVLSWLLLRGRCRDCGAPISARYPALELLTGALFAVVALVSGPPILDAALAGEPMAAAGAAVALAGLLAFAGFGIALAAIDLELHRLPNALTGPFALTALAAGIASGLLVGDPLAALRTILGSAVLLLLYLLIHLVRPDGMGAGDVKLAAALGAVLGWAGWGAFAVGAFAAFALGAAAGLLLILLRRVGRRSGIPFGPWMIAGAWIGLLAGEPLALAYLSLFGVAPR